MDTRFFRICKRFGQDRSGSTAVEFALIAPTLIAMLLGIFQIGIGMQNYNALRAISADVARYATINYQTANKLTDAQIRSYGRSVAIGSPYRLSLARLTVTVTTPDNQRVTGASEKQILINYRIPSVLGMIGMNDITLTYTRPIFLMS